MFAPVGEKVSNAKHFAAVRFGQRLVRFRDNQLREFFGALQDREPGGAQFRDAFSDGKGRPGDLRCTGAVYGNSGSGGGFG